MKDRVAQAGDHRDAGETHEGMRERNAGEAKADHEQAAGQDRACAEPVDRETGGCLRDAGNAIENAGEQADIGVAQPHFLADDQEHRREGELVVVARAVGDADQADHPDVMLKRRRGGCGGHGHLVPAIIGDPQRERRLNCAG